MTAPASKRQLPIGKTTAGGALVALCAWLTSSFDDRLRSIETSVRNVEVRQAEDSTIRAELERAERERDDLAERLENNVAEHDERLDRLRLLIDRAESKAHHVYGLLQRKRDQK